MNQLVAVPSKRFQILNVDQDIPIRQFVSRHDLPFKPGHGFYEHGKKRVLVQGTKEIVLWDRGTKELFTGKEARRMLGLPLTDRDMHLSPYNAYSSKYKVFIQSTSYNRKLLRGTLFLYEIEGWDKEGDTVWERIVDIDFV